MNITTLGIDIAKNVFQLHGVNKEGISVLTKKISRKKLLESIAQLEPCLIGMEACGGSNYWGRCQWPIKVIQNRTIKLTHPRQKKLRFRFLPKPITIAAQHKYF